MSMRLSPRPAMRVYEIAKLVGIPSKALLMFCKDTLGQDNIRSASTVVEPVFAEVLLAHFLAGDIA